GGGASSTAADAQTWGWNGSSWTMLSSGFGAGSFYAHAMSYDSDRQRLVLFGGRNSADQPMGDTWEWDGLAWTQRASTGPSPRSGHAMCYDSARHRTV